MLYPLKFEPIYKEKIWGGQKLKTLLGKNFGDLPNCGESWEISGVPGDISIIANGAFQGRDLKSLLKEKGPEIMGNQVSKKFGADFPLLIKFIDANADLSIQVHPDDQLAGKRHNSFGKTEMWYVVQADKGSKLISGFNREMTKEKYLSHFNDGRLTDILNEEMVNDNDVFFLPAGRVHTIGEGLLIGEIQQTSDITYRIYDFDRVDSEGNKRDLHVEEALDAIDYNFYKQYKTPYSEKVNERVQLVSCDYFTVNKLRLTGDFDVSLPNLDSFKIYMCLEGSAKFTDDYNETTINKGETILIPAVLKSNQIETSDGVTLLESYIDS